MSVQQAADQTPRLECSSSCQSTFLETCLPVRDAHLLHALQVKVLINPKPDSITAMNSFPGALFGCREPVAIARGWQGVEQGCAPFADASAL